MNTIDIKGCLDNLETYIHDPERMGFEDTIIPVAMWLRGFLPGDDENSMHNMSGTAIRALLCDIVDVDLNDVSRLMVLAGYSLSGNRLHPEWMMQPIDHEVVTLTELGQK